MSSRGGSSRSRRKRSRSRSRDRRDKKEKKSKEKKKKEEEKHSQKSEKSGIDTDELKKRERQEAWQKAKEAMMQEALALPPVATAGFVVPAAQSAELAIKLSGEAQALFGEDEETTSRTLDPSLVLGDLADLKAVQPMEEEDDDEENGDGGKVSDAANAEDEPDELEMYMTGIKAEHEKLLHQAPVQAGSHAELAGEHDEDDARMMAVGSDDEQFLAGASTGQKRKTLEAVDHSATTYREFRKDFYHEVEAIAKLSNAEAKAMRESLDHMVVRGKKCPRPVQSFAQTGLSDSVLDILERSDFREPTPIQAQALPAIMSGRDMIGIAKTGSGKTLAYLLPLIRHVADQPAIADRDGPIGLIIVPTRELCVQVAQELKRFKSCGVTAVAVYGGSDVSHQIGALKRGCEVIVATPGRIIDILALNGGRITNLHRVTYLVMDEADRMFDMGFSPQISKIIDNVRPTRQAVMFSATFPTSVETLARRALVNPVEIVVGGRLQVCGDVDQKIYVLPDELKFPHLLKALGEWSSKGQILIFTDRQEAVDTLSRKLAEQGYLSMTLHGGLDQLDRLSTISDFKSGLENILIATSVAARGLDVRNLVLVVNFDVPNHIEDYVHRVGRTGRAGRKGTAITFLTPDEGRYAPSLAKALTEASIKVPQKLQQLVTEYRHKVETGEVQDHKNDGYKTKGFSFSEKDAKERRRKEMAGYGIYLASDGEEEDEDEEESSGEGPIKRVDDLDEDDEAAIKTIAPRSAAAAASGGGGKSGEGSEGASSVGGGLKRAAEIAAMLAAKSKPEKEDVEVKYQTEIEINDFPQNVRYRLSMKETLDSLLEMFHGVFIMVKGTYVATGRKPMEGERKLFVEITGFDQFQVKLARREVIRMVKETAQIQSQIGQTRDRYSKYSVL